jgi:hypothetical protein
VLQSELIRELAPHAAHTPKKPEERQDPLKTGSTAVTKGKYLTYRSGMAQLLLCSRIP